MDPIDAARKLASAVRSSADEIEAEREIPRPLFEALADAGLFHLALPRSLGCPELDLPTYIQVIEVIAKADASTAWCINQGAIFATYAARMPRETARAIWIDTPRAVVANTPAPTAQAVVVPGGYRVTGRQGFSTGCRHAAWLAPHAQVIENGHVRLDNGQPETRYLFVPAAEAQLLDTWHVRGMRGTERSAWPGAVWPRSWSWRGPRRRGPPRGSSATSRWSRPTSAMPRPTSAPGAPS